MSAGVSVPEGEEAPAACPVCETDYESVTDHDSGLLINLLDNERYRRVCVAPLPGERVRFFHHTHGQAGTAPPGEGGPEGD